jgi:transcription initiation factor IIE alpha subunit
MNRANLPETSCPRCKHPLNSATELGGTSTQPAPDDLGCCMKCGEILVYTEGLQVRSAGFNALEELRRADPEMLEQLQVASAAIRN